MKKMMKRAVASLIMTAMAAAALTGCGSSDSGKSAGVETSSAGASGTASGQEMSVMLSEEPGQEDALGNALNDWAKETGNTVKQIIISNDDMLTKFPAMAKNNDVPDLVSTTGLHQLYPDEFEDMSKILDLSKFNESALKIVGKAYTEDAYKGVPYQFTTTCMYYNKDAFQAAGIEAPTVDAPWTWDELFENAKTLQEKGGTKYGFAADVSRARYDIMMYANGGSLLEKDGDSFKVTVNSPENIETLSKFVQANDEVMPKAIWAGGTTDNPVEYFKNGDAAILLSGSWNYQTFATDISKFSFGVMPTPKGSVSRSAIIGGGALAIPASAKHPELAEDFVKWLYENKDHYESFAQRDKGPSVLKDYAYEPVEDDAKADFAIIQDEVNQVTDSFMVDESASWRQYKDNEYRDALKQAVAGSVTPEDALKGFAQELAEASNWKMGY